MPQKVATRNFIVACGVLVGVMGVTAIPFFARKIREGRPLTSSEKPLTGSQVIRGAFLNTGSKDVGPDPDYDHKTGTWHGKRNKP